MNKKYIIVFSTLAVLATTTLLFNNNSNGIALNKNNNSATFCSSKTEIDTNKMTQEINNLGLYRVFNGNVPVSHTINYEKEHKLSDTFKEKSFLGADEKIIISGTADCYYEYLINLSKVKIVNDEEQKVVVYCPKAFLNRETIKRSSKTKFNEDKQNLGSILALKDSKKEALSEWEDSFEEKAYKEILRNENQHTINITTKSSIRLLMEKFGVKEKDLKIVFLNE